MVTMRFQVTTLWVVLPLEEIIILHVFYIISGTVRCETWLREGNFESFFHGLNKKRKKEKRHISITQKLNHLKKTEAIVKYFHGNNHFLQGYSPLFYSEQRCPRLSRPQQQEAWYSLTLLVLTRDPHRLLQSFLYQHQGSRQRLNTKMTK